MPRLPGMGLRLAIMVTILGTCHYYIWARLIRDMRLPSPWLQISTAGIVLLATSIPATLLLTRLTRSPPPRAVTALAFGWLGLFFITFCLLLGSDVVRLAWHVGQRFWPTALPTTPERRLFFSRLLGGGVATLAGAAGALAVRGAIAGPQVCRVDVRLRRLPQALDGMTIAQISDLHVATLLGRDYVSRVVAQVNALRPTLVAITGDLVDGTVASLQAAVAPLQELQAPSGVLFVTGNHEYYSGVDAWVSELSRLGMKVLRNERVKIGTEAASLDVAGVDDITAAAFAIGHGADLPGALRGRDPSRELVLLAHQPRMIAAAAQHGVGLMLSGHTHAGQIWPFGYLVRLVQPYLEGLHRHGDTQIYVNRGTGWWGPPMRLGTAPEITLLTLRAEPPPT